jgi:DNA-binding transcriptional MerR regulator
MTRLPWRTAALKALTLQQVETSLSLAMAKRLTIGELSRRTGVPVKTLRFYSDEGLLPPAERSASGYRLYAEEHVVRIDLIRTLREAGIGLEGIGKVLRRDVKLEEALRLRLGAIEAHVASLQRVAAALRAAIRSGASEADLRRISMVTRLSNEERRKVIERFYLKVTDGWPQSNEWVRGMVEASTPDLPDDATPEQLDAWVELATMLEDPTFIASMRAQASDFWSKSIDHEGMRKAQSEAARIAGEARARGVLPTSPEATTIVRGFISSMAVATGAEDEASVTERMRALYDPRGERYWELLALMKGEPIPSGKFADWQWLGEAMRHHLEA